MSEQMDYDLLAHTCSSQEILRVLKEQAAQIERLKALPAECDIDSDNPSTIDGPPAHCAYRQGWNDCLSEIRRAREAAKHE